MFPSNRQHHRTERRIGDRMKMTHERENCEIDRDVDRHRVRIDKRKFRANFQWCIKKSAYTGQWKTRWEKGFYRKFTIDSTSVTSLDTGCAWLYCADDVTPTLAPVARVITPFGRFPIGLGDVTQGHVTNSQEVVFLTTLRVSMEFICQGNTPGTLRPEFYVYPRLVNFLSKT